jgi:hypothetical protein
MDKDNVTELPNTTRRKEILAQKQQQSLAEAKAREVGLDSYLLGSGDLRIVALVSRGEGSKRRYSLRIAFTDLDGYRRHHDIRRGDLTARKLLRELDDLGLVVDGDRTSRDALVHELRKAKPQRKIIIVGARGWYDPCYVAPGRVLGLVKGDEADDARLADHLKVIAVLSVGQERLNPTKVELNQGRDGRTIFHFEKSEPITLHDKDAEFRITGDRMEVRKKFTLKDMEYKGKLEL